MLDFTRCETTNSLLMPYLRLASRTGLRIDRTIGTVHIPDVLVAIVSESREWPSRLKARLNKIRFRSLPAGDMHITRQGSTMAEGDGPPIPFPSQYLASSRKRRCLGGPKLFSSTAENCIFQLHGFADSGLRGQVCPSPTRTLDSQRRALECSLKLSAAAPLSDWLVSLLAILS